ncbi:MAG: hypothetical protein H0W67_05880, partial [Gemmatimonadales bacterium]|nr:hypothetical protein [Gemmatimonadales bacterium]
RVQPRDAKKDERIAPAVTVAVEDAAGNPVTSPGFQVTLDLARSSDERIRLRGDLSRRTEEGVAVFDDLRVDSEAGDLRLRAQADGLSDVESASFEIRDD